METVQVLSELDVYKVGHHGSRNAAPKRLFWEKLSKRGLRPRACLVTLLSTISDKNPGVPKKSLTDALDAETVLHSTAYLCGEKDFELCGTMVIDV